MASAFARTLPSSLSSRTIFVKCSPAPSNFTERRAILKALATAGKKKGLEVFKRLEDNSSFIAVTVDPECAKTLVDESPYKRILHVQDSATAATFATTAWGAAFRTTIADPVNIQPLEEWQGGSKSDKPINGSSLGLKSKIFTIHVFPGNPTYSHKREVSQNPLHGPWPTRDGYETFISAALKKTVPRGHLAAGLRDWETGNQLSEDSAGAAEESAESLLGKSTRHKRAAYEERRRKAETGIPDVMTSLVAVAESARNSVPRMTSIESNNISKDSILSEDTRLESVAIVAEPSQNLPEAALPVRDDTLAEGHNMLHTRNKGTIPIQSDDHLSGSPASKNSKINSEANSLQDPIKLDDTTRIDSKGANETEEKVTTRQNTDNQRLSPSDAEKTFNGP